MVPHLRFPVLRGLFGLCFALFLAPRALAQAQTDLTTPTAWWYQTSATPQEVSQRVTLGYRIVDLEVIDESPLTFAASFVHNSGAYAKGWSWYYDQTSLGVSLLLSQNNSRAIDIEPYETANGLRYAVVMIANTGADFSPSQGWQTGYTGADVGAWINSNPTRRIIDIQPYVVGGAQRYAFIWLSNTGVHHSPWWILINATTADISDVIQNQQARIIDLERHAGGRYSAVFTPADGKAWYYLYQISGSEVARLSEQLASRIIDIERSTSGLLVRYDVVLRQNDNDLAVATNVAMRDGLSLDVTSGFLLRELDSTPATLAGVNESRSFEPASLMKTAHHFTAMRRVALGADSLGAAVTENAGLNGSCPTGSNPVTRTLSAVLRDMMEVSSNTATEAIRARYGTSMIESTCAAFGATGVALNHTLGCLCGMTRNEIRLDDLSALHLAVANGILGTQRATFYDLMSNGTNFGMGVHNTSTTLAQELAASSLNTVERQAFSAGILLAHKGGSYACYSPGHVEEHRSRGAYVRLPFRSGCNTVYREYFIGAWVNDAVTGISADNATGAGIESLFRSVVREAIDSWESALCIPTAEYCTAAPNSTGNVGICSITGSTYIVQDNLTLRASNLPTMSFGYLLVSTTSGFSPGAGGSAGNLCLGGSIGRYSNFVASTGTTGTLARPFDQDGIPTPSGVPGSVQAGDTLYFQWWHRDSSPTGSPSSNFTRGVRVTFI
ncbi:serine hydrolase [Saltatorellus ferox]